VSAERAIEWKSVPPIEDAYKRRDLFLDLKQRRALIKAATEILAHLRRNVTVVDRTLRPVYE
jgi:hypothetical protein